MSFQAQLTKYEPIQNCRSKSHFSTFVHKLLSSSYITKARKEINTNVSCQTSDHICQQLFKFIPYLTNMLELMKLMNFRSNGIFSIVLHRMEKCDFNWQLLFNSCLVIFLYNDTKKIPLDSWESTFYCYIKRLSINSISDACDHAKVRLPFFDTPVLCQKVGKCGCCAWNDTRKVSLKS